MRLGWLLRARRGRGQRSWQQLWPSPMLARHGAQPAGTLTRGRHGRLAAELELKQHALGLLRERAAGSESAQLAAAVAASEAEAAEAATAAADARDRKAAMAASAKVGPRQTTRRAGLGRHLRALRWSARAAAAHLAERVCQG